MRLFENNELTILLYMYVFALIYLFRSQSTFYFYTKKGFFTQSVFSFNPPILFSRKKYLLVFN